MKNKKPFNHFWWIIPTLFIFFFAIFFIFRSFNEKCLELRDWLAFVGSYLGFAGSVILGYVAIYQNRKLRDDNEKQHKNIRNHNLSIFKKTQKQYTKLEKQC